MANARRRCGLDRVMMEALEPRLLLSGSDISVYITAGEQIEGTSLVKYVVHMLGDTVNDAAIGWKGEFTGPLHQVWTDNGDGTYGPTPTGTESLWLASEASARDSHFLPRISQLFVVSGWEPQEDMPGMSVVRGDWGQWRYSPTEEGAGSQMQGEFCFGSSIQSTDVALAQIVLASGDTAT